jgi:uridylate kinase
MIDGRLRVMDLSAVVMCQQNHVPIIVFNLKKSGNMRAVAVGEAVGTLVDDGEVNDGEVDDGERV